MSQQTIVNAEEQMKKEIEYLKHEFTTIRTSRATPALLDKIQVEAYGSPMPLKQLANISAPEPRLLIVQPYDKSIHDAVMKAIQKSDLSVTPQTDGNLIRIVIPPLTEERRKDLVKIIRKKIEEGKISVRNVRRDANEDLKKNEKEGTVSEDQSRRMQDQVQKLTDRYVKELDNLFAAKEREIMEI
ncbi:MAG: ribosome recycling factor [Armatimonadetes bacterium]|nr:ribosome recycling factor [Armatimonadota bacterium]